MDVGPDAGAGVAPLPIAGTVVGAGDVPMEVDVPVFGTGAAVAKKVGPGPEAMDYE